MVTFLSSDEVVTAAATTTIAVPVHAYFPDAFTSPSVGLFWMRSSFPLFVRYVSCCDDGTASLRYFLHYCACVDASLTGSAPHSPADTTDMFITSSTNVEPEKTSSFAVETTARSQNAEGKCTLTPIRICIFMYIFVYNMCIYYLVSAQT